MSTTIHPLAASTIQSEYALFWIGGAPPSFMSTLKQLSRSISSTHSCSISNPPRSASTCRLIFAFSFSSNISWCSSGVNPSSFKLLRSVSISLETNTAYKGFEPGAPSMNWIRFTVTPRGIFCTKTPPPGSIPWAVARFNKLPMVWKTGNVSGDSCCSD